MYLVIPAADAELATQAVGAGAVIHTRAVLGWEAEGQLNPGSAVAQLPVLPTPQHCSFSGAPCFRTVVGDGLRVRGN